MVHVRLAPLGARRLLLRMTLRKALARALETHAPALSESGCLRLHTVFSRPLLVRSLYPLAHIHPSDACTPPDAPAHVWQEQVLITAAWRPDDGDERLAYALELYVYTLPSRVRPSSTFLNSIPPATVLERIRGASARTCLVSTAKRRP